MIEDLDDAAFADRAGLEILHTVLAGEVDGLDPGDGIDNLRAFLGALQDIHLIPDENFDRRLAGPFTFTDPLLDSFEGRPLTDVEQVNDRGRPIHILMDVFVVAFLAGHIEVDDLVLVGIVDVEGCLSRYNIVRTYLDVELTRFLVLNHTSESLGDGVEESALANARITDERNLETEVVVVIFLLSGSLILRLRHEHIVLVVGLIERRS